MNNVVEKQCPACGGPIQFDPVSGKLVCEYCGTVVEIEEAPQTEAAESINIEGGFDFNSLNAQATDPDAEALPIYNCTACGAEIIASAENFALNCPYCGNNIVLTQKVSGNLRPDGVIPFKFTAKDLPDMMKKYYKNKPFLPKRFFSENTMGKVTGLYVPFWVFSGTLSGDLTYAAETVRHYRQGDYDCKDTSHYQLGRNVSMRFEDLPVDASDKVEDELMDSIEPFDMNDVKPFDMAYLAGYTADRFDVAKNDIAKRAEDRMQNTARGIAARRGAVEYDSARITGGRLKADLTARYLLFPAYLFSIRFGGKDYRFAVNGQTGQIAGTLPTDKKVKTVFFLKRLLIVLAVIIALALISYFSGR